MGRYIIKRLLLTIPVLLGASILIFSLVRLIPGDIVTLLIGDEVYVGAETAQRMRAQYGLDQPIYVQYAKWLFLVLQGNLGQSLRTQEPVMQTILSKLPLTAELAVVSIFFSALVAIPLGVISAVRSNSVIDFFSRLLAIGGLSIPGFWMASMFLLISSVVFGWTPANILVSPLENPVTNMSQVFMPVLVLSTHLMAVVMRMTRSTMLEVMGQDYIQTARAKGLTPRTVMFGHALKNSLIPVVTVMGIQLGHLLGGVVIIEQVFGLPGVGWLLLNAVYQRDYPLVQGTVLFITLSFVVINLLVDLLYAYLDPRIRYS